MKSLLLLLTGAALAAPCLAGPKGYDDAAAAYKTEMKIDDLPLVNVGFLGDFAGSKAKRKADAMVAENEASAESPAARNARAESGLRFASPTIYGTVRGDLTIIVQRGAVRGAITSIRR